MKITQVLIIAIASLILCVGCVTGQRNDSSDFNYPSDNVTNNNYPHPNNEAMNNAQKMYSY